LASPRNNNEKIVEQGNHFFEELPWLVEVVPSEVRRKSTDKKGKKAKPKISRSFPWTMAAIYDANILGKQNSKQRYFTGNSSLISTTTIIPTVLGVSNNNNNNVRSQSFVPSNKENMRNDLRTFKEKKLQRSQSANVILKPFGSEYRSKLDRKFKRRTKSAGGIRRISTNTTVPLKKKLSPLMYRKHHHPLFDNLNLQTNKGGTKPL
jgi:hypothetical protein